MKTLCVLCILYIGMRTQKQQSMKQCSAEMCLCQSHYMAIRLNNYAVSEVFDWYHYLIIVLQSVCEIVLIEAVSVKAILW